MIFPADFTSQEKIEWFQEQLLLAAEAVRFLETHWPVSKMIATVRTQMGYYISEIRKLRGWLPI